MKSEHKNRRKWMPIKYLQSVHIRPARGGWVMSKSSKEQLAVNLNWRDCSNYCACIIDNFPKKCNCWLVS